MKSASSGHNKRRAALVYLAGAIGLMCSMVQEANAHGAVGSPMARQYQCQLEGGFWWPEDGSAIPNSDCRAAFHAGGNSAYPFTQWNEVAANPSDPNNLETVKQAVPDGLLCAGGDRRKAGLDVPAANWRKTPLVVPRSGYIELTWELSALHAPSRMMIFITNPGHNPNQPLRWSDLRLIHNAPTPDPIPANGGGHIPGFIQGFYKLNVAIPADISGDAVIYSYWQRIDPRNEAFFSCSDVNIQRASRIRYQNPLWWE
ncbi:chitin-binding protein [Mortierella sp. GBAus27b]|nr:hypothetical protein BGX31_002654 [Mortierella sp. GBA43]KAI8345750.1 chitin-binding protein [Mortierella sp. GBAus27b]